MSRDNIRGSTMIIALWSLFLLTIFAVQLGVIVRQKITLVYRLDDRDTRYLIAEAGVKQAIVQLRKEDAIFAADFLGERWNDQSDTFQDICVGKGTFTVSYHHRDGEYSRIMYGLQDEESKINLNKAEVEVITRLIETVANITHWDAQELAYCIIDWRDKDSFFQHPQFGAEDSDYRGKKNSFEAKDSDFEVIEELLLVDKMDQEVFDKLKYFVTIYGEGEININTASREVLLALGLNGRVVGNILSFRKGSDMIAGTGDDDIFLQSATIIPRLSQVFDLSPSDISVLSNLVAAGKFTVKSENFMIRSVGRLDHKKGQTTIVAVAERTGQIKYWREEI
ncbi:MAG: general secretion pathway protein GspK [Candidatus Omnitrophica bacterium]|nr:general secretion pathway protein GspK [Candidatus Omnitrophota bacterium]